MYVCIYIYIYIYTYTYHWPGRTPPPWGAWRRSWPRRSADVGGYYYLLLPLLFTTTIRYLLVLSTITIKYYLAPKLASTLRGRRRIILAIFYPPLKWICGCVWLFLQAREGNIYFTELAERVEYGNYEDIIIVIIVIVIVDSNSNSNN